MDSGSRSDSSIFFHTHNWTRGQGLLGQRIFFSYTQSDSCIFFHTTVGLLANVFQDNVSLFMRTVGNFLYFPYTQLDSRPRSFRTTLFLFIHTVGLLSLSGRRRLARSRVTQVWLAGFLDCRSVVSGSVSPTGVGHLSLSGRRRLAQSRAKQGWASLFMQTACARWPEAPRDRVTKTQTIKSDHPHCSFGSKASKEDDEPTLEVLGVA